jgi:metal-responsive CopG/Arc/MetJ family transcriptional regulator
MSMVDITDDELRIVSFHIPTKLLSVVDALARKEFTSRSDILRRAILIDLRNRVDFDLD